MREYEIHGRLREIGKPTKVDANIQFSIVNYTTRQKVNNKTK